MGTSFSPYQFAGSAGEISHSDLDDLTANDHTHYVHGYDGSSNVTGITYYQTAITPVSPQDGDLWYHTTTDELFYYENGAWLGRALMITWGITGVLSASAALYIGNIQVLPAWEWVAQKKYRIVHMACHTKDNVNPHADHVFRTNKNKATGTDETSWDGSSAEITKELSIELAVGDSFRPFFFHGGSTPDPDGLIATYILRRRP